MNSSTGMRTVMTLDAAFVLVGCTSGNATGNSGAGEGQQVALAQTSGTTVAGPEGITVVGEGRIRGRPDTVEATLGVEIRRDTVQEALDAANQAARDLIAALQDAGVDEADIQTTDVSVHPERIQPDPQQPPTTDGYVARNRLRVTIDGVDDAGSVLQQAIEAAGDAATLDGFVLALREDTELVARAREEAFAHARATAEQYAEVAGVELGSLIGITETSGAGSVALAATEAAGDAAASVPIAPGTQDVTVRVTTTWALQ